MFVGWSGSDSGWHDLDRLGIVSGVFGVNGLPVAMRPSKMQQVMRKWGGGRLAPEHHRYLRSGVEFDVGDRLRIDAGSFEGCAFDVVDISEDGVKGLVKMMGGMASISIPASHLGPL